MTSWDPGLPFNELAPTPPAVVPHPTLLLETGTAIARADAYAETLPNSGAIAAVIPILEARASSEIENIVTTNDELLREAAGVGNATPATIEAMRARSALLEGARAVETRPVSIGIVRLVAAELLGHEVSVREGPGVYVGDPRTRARIYTPPEGRRRLETLLDAWASYVHDPLVDPLTRMALGHFQFEAIHPFHDGNGRTGRVLNQLILIESGLIARPILYLSGIISERKREYYQHLAAVTADGSWDEWLTFMLECTRDSANWTRARAVRIRDAHDAVASAVDRHLPRGVSTRFVDALFANVYVTIGDVTSSCSVTRQTASSWLHRLVEAQVLDELDLGRSKAFANLPFRDALLM